MRSVVVLLHWGESKGIFESRPHPTVTHPKTDREYRVVRSGLLPKDEGSSLMSNIGFPATRPAPRGMDGDLGIPGDSYP